MFIFSLFIICFFGFYFVYVFPMCFGNTLFLDYEKD
jgi:hypothetical protein